MLLEQPGAIWGGPPTLQPLCLPRTTRSSGSGHPSTWLGGAAPWLPSTSWASSTWPTLVTAGTAPQGSPQLLLSDWGHPSRVVVPEVWLVRNARLQPCLGEGEGGRAGQSHPLPAPCLGDNVLCCDLCVCQVHRQGCRTASQNLGCAPSFLTTSSLLPRWLWILWPLLLARAWAAGWRVKVALSKAFKNVQKVILEYTSYQRPVSGEGHESMCSGSLEPKNCNCCRYFQGWANVTTPVLHYCTCAHTPKQRQKGRSTFH